MADTLSSDAILRLTAELVGAELVAGGRALPQAEQARWTAATEVGAGGLALDSLELLACGAAVNRFFHLHETGIEDLLLMERALGGWAAVVARSLEESFARVTFTTSGSTGEPKPVTHGVAALRDEVAFWAAGFAGRERVVALVPPHHIYGFLFTALLPDALGAPPLLDARALAPGALRRELRPTDLLVGHPTSLALLLRNLTALPPGIAAVSSTAPLPPATRAALRAAGCAEVVEVYGSSETAGVGARRSPDAPFALLPRWRAGGAGDAASVVDAATDEEFALPDRAAWESDGRALRLLGCKDEAVQVGGINVFPRAVEARLRAIEGVAEAAVRLDASLPEPRLKAFLVPAPGVAGEALLRRVEAACRRELSAAERPARLAWGPALPRNAMGKLADWPTGGGGGENPFALEGVFTGAAQTAA